MIWMILLTVVFVGGFLIGGESLAEASFGLVFGPLLGLVVALIIGAATPGTHRVTAAQVPLQSLADGSSRIHGSFFLGSGTIDSSSVYVWYEQTAPNAYKQREADASASTIHFLEPGQRPYYIQHYDVDDHKPGLKLWRIVLPEASSDYDTYDFYVPQGTIKHNYVLDSR